MRDLYRIWLRRHGAKATPLARTVMKNEQERFKAAIAMPRTKDRKRYAPKGNAAWRALDVKGQRGEPQ